MRRHSRQLFGIALGIICGWMNVARSGDFELTRDGVPTATIVIAETAVDSSRQAAQELQLHIQKITGATLPIVSDKEKIKGSRILIGPSLAMTARGLDVMELKDQQYRISFRDSDLLLLGKDQSTGYAVHDFLERFCDVRWYGPGDSQMVHPRTTSLTVKARELQRRPEFLWRTVFPWTKFEMARELYGQPSDTELNQFWYRHRLGGEAYACNHSLEGYYDRFWKRNPKNPDLFSGGHPEWFANGYSTAELNEFGGQPPQLCYSHPGLIKQVVADARRYFDGEGTAPGAEAAGRYFALVPMDRGGRVGWCRCSDCQSQIDQARLKENQFDSNGSASDYWFKFVNKVARGIANTHPDKYISTLAYAGYSYYPRKVILEPNITVQMCLHTRNCWAPGMQEDELQWYEDWVKNERGRPLYVWLYHCLPELQNVGGAPFQCFPGFHAHAIDQQFKRFARDDIRGAFIEGVSDQVDCYVTMKLMIDPSLNVDDLLNELFQRYYGAAAEPMQKFYQLVEEAYCDPGSYPAAVLKERKRDFFQTEEMAWKYLGNEARMTKLNSLIDQATMRANGDVEQQRVALFRKAVWDHMVEGRDRYLLRTNK